MLSLRVTIVQTFSGVEASVDPHQLPIKELVDRPTLLTLVEYRPGVPERVTTVVGDLSYRLNEDGVLADFGKVSEILDVQIGRLDELVADLRSEATRQTTGLRDLMSRTDLSPADRKQVTDMFAALAAAGSAASTQERMAEAVEAQIEQVERDELHFRELLVETADLRDQVAVLRDETQQMRDDTAQASGAAGENAMASHWEAFREGEHKREWWWRGFAIAAALSTLALAIFLPVGYDAAAIVHRSAVALAGVTLTGYLFAETGRHRRSASWAAHMRVQLNSLNAYCNNMDDVDAVVAVKREFASRVFGDGPDSRDSDGDGGDAIKVAIEQVAGRLPAARGS